MKPFFKLYLAMWAIMLRIKVHDFELIEDSQIRWTKSNGTQVVLPESRFLDTLNIPCFEGWGYINNVWVALRHHVHDPYRLYCFLTLLQESSIKGKKMDVMAGIPNANDRLHLLNALTWTDHLPDFTYTEAGLVISLQPESDDVQQRIDNYAKLVRIQQQRKTEQVWHHHFIATTSGGIIKKSHYRSLQGYFINWGKGQGAKLQSDQQIQYDLECAKTNKDAIISEAIKGLEEGKCIGVTIQQLKTITNDLRKLLSKLFDLLIEGHRNGNMTFDLRGRFYAYAGSIITYQSSKLLRACLSVNEGFVSWKTISKDVIWSYGELTGATKGYTSWKAAYETAKIRWNEDLKKKLPEMPIGDWEALWAWRLLRERKLMLEAARHGYQHVWSVPVEVDQHASYASYYGALFGIKDLLIATNTIEDHGNKHDYYESSLCFDRKRRAELQAAFDAVCPNKKTQRDYSKWLRTPTAYSSSTKMFGGIAPALRLLSHNPYAKRQAAKEGFVDKMVPDVYGNLKLKTAVELWYDAHVEAINACWRIVLAETPTAIAETLQIKSEETCKRSNGHMRLNMGNNDYIYAQTGHFQQEHICTPEGKEYDQDVTVNEKINIPQLKQNHNARNRNERLHWVEKERTVPVWYFPDSLRFSRYMATALIHHQDAITADYVSWILISEGHFCLTIHDAFIVHPAAVTRCKELVQERLWDVYQNRKTILNAFMGNFGKRTYDDLLEALVDLGMESAPALNRKDFMGGCVLK